MTGFCRHEARSGGNGELEGEGEKTAVHGQEGSLKWGLEGFFCWSFGYSWHLLCKGRYGHGLPFRPRPNYQYSLKFMWRVFSGVDNTCVLKSFGHATSLMLPFVCILMGLDFFFNCFLILFLRLCWLLGVPMLYLCYPSPNIELLHCRGCSVKFGQNVEGRVNLSFSFTGHLGTEFLLAGAI